jgi:hypothetical protein
MSKRYNVTLNFNFDYMTPQDDFSDFDSESESDDGSDAESIVNSIDEEYKAERAAFRRTDEYYRTHSLEEHVKENDAFSFVEYICCDGEVISAEWDTEKFQIHMVVETTQTKEQLIRDIEGNSLEDGEYEACGETGWIVMTRGPNGETCTGSLSDMKNYWTYCVTDYRNNPIEVEEIKPKKTKVKKTPSSPKAVALEAV